MRNRFGPSHEPGKRSRFSYRSPTLRGRQILPSSKRTSISLQEVQFTQLGTGDAARQRRNRRGNVPSALVGCRGGGARLLAFLTHGGPTVKRLGVSATAST